METNNTFSLPRLGLYMKKQLVANYKFYLLAVIGLFLLMTLVGVLIVVLGHYSTTQKHMMPAYYLFLCFSLVLFTCRSFQELGGKETGVDFLMLPASQFEKFFSQLLITTVGFMLVFHLCAFMAFEIAGLVHRAIYDTSIPLDFPLFSHPDEKIYIYVGAMIGQAMFLLGSSYFHKFSYLKTFLSIVVLAAAFALLNSLFLQIIFGGNMYHWSAQLPFVLIGAKDPANDHSAVMYIIPESLQHGYLFIVKFLLAPILWTLAYFRLKDQEI
ncbi:hypothetical protein [Chitinophaga vietnamensis]|uniref:hypothetical protein n=1 Tax=Chitinophaga vietnamensis TaxID=2593957 RepID=UPI00117755B0|nr:hypothetical protein [Chitinophaga vietnamensis]